MAMALETHKTINFNGTSTLGGIMLAQFYGTINPDGSVNVNESQMDKLSASEQEAEQKDFDAFRTMVKELAGDERGE